MASGTNKPFHYNIATEGVNACNPKILAVLGFLKIIDITIEELPGKGGPVGSTEGRLPRYKIHVRVALKDMWWEREYIVDKSKKVNVVVKFLNSIAHAITARAYAFLKKVRQPNVSVKAEIIDKTDK